MPKTFQMTDAHMTAFSQQSADGGPARACTAEKTADLLVKVKSRDDGSPVAAARAGIAGPESRKGTTNSDGQITFRGLAPGSYSVEGEKNGYGPDRRQAQVACAVPNQVELLLAETVLTVAVKEREKGTPLDDALVELSGPEKREARTDHAGHAEFRRLSAGTYVIDGSKEDYGKDTTESQVVLAQRNAAELSLPKRRLRIRLFDAGRQAMPQAPYRLTIGKDTRKGYANQTGWIEEGLPDSNLPESCLVEWGPGAQAGAYRYSRTVFLKFDGGDEQSMQRRFHNLGYSADRPLASNISRFQQKYGLGDEQNNGDALAAVRDEHDNCFRTCKELFAGLAASRPSDEDVA